LQENWHENQKKKFESKNPGQEYDEKNNPIENNRMRSNASQSYRRYLHHCMEQFFNSICKEWINHFPKS